jgi:hypothetical protein
MTNYYYRPLSGYGRCYIKSLIWVIQVFWNKIWALRLMFKVKLICQKTLNDLVEDHILPYTSNHILKLQYLLQATHSINSYQNTHIKILIETKTSSKTFFISILNEFFQTNSVSKSQFYRKKRNLSFIHL